MNLQQQLDLWHTKYPWDYLWRKKYNIAFGSKAHLEANFLFMKLDLLEDSKLELMKKRSVIDKDLQVLDDSKVLKEQRIKPFTEAELDDVFGSLDFNSIDEQLNKK